MINREIKLYTTTILVVLGDAIHPLLSRHTVVAFASILDARLRRANVCATKVGRDAKDPYASSKDYAQNHKASARSIVRVSSKEVGLATVVANMSMKMVGR